jgi:hypothetical protein
VSDCRQISAPIRRCPTTVSPAGSWSRTSGVCCGSTIGQGQHVPLRLLGETALLLLLFLDPLLLPIQELARVDELVHVLFGANLGDLGSLLAVPGVLDLLGLAGDERRMGVDELLDREAGVEDPSRR